MELMELMVLMDSKAGTRETTTYIMTTMVKERIMEIREDIPMTDMEDMDNRGTIMEGNQPVVDVMSVSLVWELCVAAV